MHWYVLIVDIIDDVLVSIRDLDDDNDCYQQKPRIRTIGSIFNEKKTAMHIGNTKQWN